MSSNFYQLLKYAKTGIASPDMTAYDKLRALAMGGAKYPVATITGVPPLSYLADGRPLISVSMLGNSRQDGTPAQDDPIYPEFVGVSTANLFDVSAFVSVCRMANCTAVAQGTGITITPSSEDSYIGASYKDGQIIGQTDRLALIPVQENTTYTLLLSQAPKAYITYVDSGYAAVNDNYIRITQTDSPIAYVFTTPTGCSFVLFRLGRNGTGVYTYDNIMLAKGQKELNDFEPYGYKLTITSANQTVPVYLGQTRTTRRVRKLVLTGEEDWIAGANKTYYITNITDYLRWSEVPISICSHYESQAPVLQASLVSDMSLTFFKTTSVGFSRLYIRDTSLTTVEAFKAHLAAQYAAGIPVTVWYVMAEPETDTINEPLAKIGDYADALDSADAGIVIPTWRGINTLAVGTDLQPSSVSITGHIKPV